jgi:hypothetical protein
MSDKTTRPGKASAAEDAQVPGNTERSRHELEGTPRARLGGLAHANPALLQRKLLQRALERRAAREEEVVSTGTRDLHQTAAHGISGASGPLPHLETLQRAFGRHDVSHIQAHTDAPAAEAARAMDAEAFASGTHVAFAGTPSLHTAAHEAAHVVQQTGGVQLAGGVGQENDPHEQHADAVADLVVQGRSAEPLLDAYARPAQEAPAPLLQRKLVAKPSGKHEDSRSGRVFVHLEGNLYREEKSGEVFSYDESTFQFIDADKRHFDPCTGKRLVPAGSWYLSLDGSERYYYKNGHYWPDLSFDPEAHKQPQDKSKSPPDTLSDKQEVGKEGSEKSTTGPAPEEEGKSGPPPLYAESVGLLAALSRSLGELRKLLQGSPERYARCRRHLQELLEKLPRGVAYSADTRLGSDDLQAYRGLCGDIAGTWSDIDSKLGTEDQTHKTFAEWSNPKGVSETETHDTKAKSVPLLESGQVHADVFGEGRYPGAINIGNTEDTSTTGGAGRRVPRLVFRNFSPKDKGLNTLPIADGSVDLVTAENGPIGFPGVIDEIARIAKGGGTIIVFGPSDFSEFHGQLIELLHATEVTQVTSGEEDQGGFMLETRIQVPR